MTRPNSNYDINRDGLINNDDIEALKKILAGATDKEIMVYVDYCDVNGDGDVNTTDLVALRKVFSQISKFDVNGDGKVDEKDIEALRAYIEGSDAETVNKDVADINGDGVIDEKDIEALRQFLTEFQPIEFEHSDETVLELSCGKEAE